MENFKVYGCKIDSFAYPEIKINQYGNVSIKGDFQELNLDCEYIIKGEEQQIIVKNIDRHRQTLSNIL